MFSFSCRSNSSKSDMAAEPWGSSRSPPGSSRSLLDPPGASRCLRFPPGRAQAAAAPSALGPRSATSGRARPLPAPRSAPSVTLRLFPSLLGSFRHSSALSVTPRVFPPHFGFSRHSSCFSVTARLFPPLSAAPHVFSPPLGFPAVFRHPSRFPASPRFFPLSVRSRFVPVALQGTLSRFRCLFGAPHRLFTPLPPRQV